VAVKFIFNHPEPGGIDMHRDPEFPRYNAGPTEPNRRHRDGDNGDMRALVSVIAVAVVITIGMFFLSPPRRELPTLIASEAPSAPMPTPSSPTPRPAPRP
jgi:hypothetical protein